MIKAKMQDAINEQINAEFYSAFIYLSMASYFEDRNLPGFSNWMRVQFQEEQAHAMGLLNYLVSRGGKVKLATLEGPQVDFASIVDVFEVTLAHEQHVTSLINNLMDIAGSEKDFAASSFLNWYVKEQVEEESNAETILSQLKIINGEGQGVLMLDRELATRMFVQPVIA